MANTHLCNALYILALRDIVKKGLEYGPTPRKDVQTNRKYFEVQSVHVEG